MTEPKTLMSCKCPFWGERRGGCRRERKGEWQDLCRGGEGLGNRRGVASGGLFQTLSVNMVQTNFRKKGRKKEVRGGRKYSGNVTWKGK